MPIIDHFGLFASHYDRVFKPGDRDWLLETVALPVDGILLDAGGGTGRIAQLFQGHASQVVVADLSAEMLSQTKNKDGLDPTCAPSELLPFANQQFDRIIMIDAFHHVCNQRETVQELWRVLTPGGRLVIEEPDVRTFGVKLLAVAEKAMGMRSHFLSPPKIAALFDNNAEIKIVRKGIISWVLVDKPDP